MSVMEALSNEITPRSFDLGAAGGTTPQNLARASVLCEVDERNGEQYRVHDGVNFRGLGFWDIAPNRVRCVDPLPPLAEMERRKR